MASSSVVFGEGHRQGAQPYRSAGRGGAAAAVRGAAPTGVDGFGSVSNAPDGDGYGYERHSAATARAPVPEDSDRTELNQIKRAFTDLLESDEPELRHLHERMDEVAESDARRLVLSADALRAAKPELAAGLLEHPLKFLPPCEAALADVMIARMPHLAGERVNKELKRFQLGFEGAFGARRVSPRGLQADMIGKMVCVDGIVTRTSAVRPKVIQSVHYVPATGQMKVRDYRDGISLDADAMRGPTPALYPSKDDDGNPMETEFGLSSYRDYQSASLQEMPERAPAGQLPRSADVVLEGDLVDACRPGARVRIVGTYRALGGKSSSYFATKIVANNVVHLNDEHGAFRYTERDLANMRQMAQTAGGVDLLSASLAPSICGHALIKKALLLLLLGGNEHNLANGTHLRGDINILMVGDPSTAKSQLLRFVLGVAPLAVSTTGRGSSGVGLTAAVTSDPDTGERHLEAGAMVLGDRGIVCIDEFDKMSDLDRVSIHEAMEQQTVTIAKAGIHTTLNARCSVVAAANPVYGTYDKRRKPADNIALQDSLLSRFDLLFIVLDTVSRERDERIASHVLNMHQFRRSGDDGTRDTLDDPDDEADRRAEAQGFGGADAGGGGGGTGRAAGGPMDDAEEADEESAHTTPVFEKQQMTGHVDGGVTHRVVSVAFLQKYVHYAKKLRPRLTPEAAEYIAARYRDLRSKDDTRTLPITARQLETLIRLSTAHAKLRLKLEVDTLDARAAFDIVNFALYNEAKTERPPRTPRRDAADGANDHHGDGGDGGDGGGSRRSSTPSSEQRRKRRSQRRGSALDPYDFDLENDEDEDDAAAAGEADRGVVATRRSRMRRRAVAADASEHESAAAAADDAMADADATAERMEDDKEKERDRPDGGLATGEAVDLSYGEDDVMGTPAAAAGASEQVVERVRRAVHHITASQRTEAASLEQVIEALHDDTLSRREIEAALMRMDEMEQIMYREGVIFRLG